MGLEGVGCDDLLWTIWRFRQTFQLGKTTSCWNKITEYASSEQALTDLIERTVEVHGDEILTNMHPLLKEIGIPIQSKPIRLDAYTGRRIPQHLIRETLRNVLETALLTIAQLPQRDPPVGHTTKEFRRLASRLHELSGKTRVILSRAEAGQRIGVYFRKDEAGRERLFGIADEIQRAGDMLAAIVSQTKISRPRWDSPNPQIRLALYMVGWLEISTGTQSYESFKTLLEATFARRPN